MDLRHTLSWQRRWGAIAVLLTLLVFGAAAASAEILVVNSASNLDDEEVGDGACSTGSFGDLGDGPEPLCSLAAAVQEANALTGPDDVVFDPRLQPNFGAFIRIFATSPIRIYETLRIDGTTAAGYAVADAHAVPVIQLDGRLLSQVDTDGLIVTEAAAGSALHGIAVYGFPDDGLLIEADDVTVEGCFIGLREGAVVESNGGDGIELTSSSERARIGLRLGPGDVVIGASNVISGNGEDGIRAYGADHRIVGNVIGGTPAGDDNRLGEVETGNRGHGVTLFGSGSAVGETWLLTSGERIDSGNVIVGNGLAGILSVGFTHSIVGNHIGADASGTRALANKAQGIVAKDMVQLEIRGNLISGNRTHGVQLGNPFSARLVTVVDNRIGVDGDGVLPLPNGEDGIQIGPFDEGHEVRGNVIGGNADDGIEIRGAESEIIGNWIGTNPSGDELGNGGDGVDVFGSETPARTFGNVIGGGEPGAGNVIGHNGGHGVVVRALALHNAVLGNWIGTDTDGEARGNGGHGLFLDSNNRVEGNVIGFNQDGIHVFGDANQVEANYVGTDPEGRDLGNLGDGIEFFGHPFTLKSARENVIGSHWKTPGEEIAARGNEIAFNAGDGVKVGRDNFANPFGGVRENAVRGNRIHSNDGMGIDLFPAGRTANDAGDADGGSNQLQNFPEIDPVGTAADPATGTLQVRYQVDADVAAATYPLVVDFYQTDATGGAGQVYLGSDVIPPEEAGQVRDVAIVVPPEVVLGGAIVATTTDSSGVAGNTSEFSEPLAIGGPDGDGDGVEDVLDNCVTAANGPLLPDAGGNVQLDVDGDGFGNACDADFNQDGLVGGPDFDVFLQCFNQSVPASGPGDDPECAESDMNGDGFVGGPDFGLFLGGFGAPPGS